MKKAVSILLAFTLGVTLSGCLDVHRPIVPSTVLTNSNHDWVVTNGDPVEGDGLQPKAIETQYRYDADDDGDAYPGLLVLIGLRTATRIDEADLLATARDFLDEQMDESGVAAESISEETGSRTIESGATTQWLTMTGTAESSSLLFSQAQEIRVLAEAWYDDSSNMHVVAIAIAQTSGTDFFGNPRTDLAVWNELVGDAEGSIEGAKHTEGFIDHVHIED